MFSNENGGGYYGCESPAEVGVVFDLPDSRSLDDDTNPLLFSPIGKTGSLVSSPAELTKSEQVEQLRITEMVSPMRAMQAKNQEISIDGAEFKTKVDNLSCAVLDALPYKALFASSGPPEGSQITPLMNGNFLITTHYLDQVGMLIPLQIECATMVAMQQFPVLYTQYLRDGGQATPVMTFL